MSHIKVMSAGAVQSMVTALGPEFERASGHHLNLNFNTVGSLRARLEGGEATDIAILSESAIAALDKKGLFLPGSIVEPRRHHHRRRDQGGRGRAGHLHTGGVQAGALEGARRLLFRSGRGRLVRHLFCGVLEKLGIADAVRPKAVLGKRGFEVAQAVADGRAEIGTTFISEALTVKGLQGGRPAAGRPAQRQYLYRGHPCQERRARGRPRFHPHAYRPGRPPALGRCRAGAGILRKTPDLEAPPDLA